ncbi:MAG TPA: serine/threonine-protein kinase [Myxococcaceae bacterium]|nr:serine/threonine-protein kinase [Myxococcaceae bacterium]
METSLNCPKCQKSFAEAPNYCPACGEDLRGLTPLSDTLSGPWTGKLIDGRYRIREKLGEGGMGAVYKVEHVRMGKLLALKVLRPELAVDKKLKGRFHQEARVVSRLSHPNTIQVFDFGELEDGELYIAMEYLPGRDLAATLRAHGALSEERAISIATQVLASLGEAHEKDIIHRDIKPANVMLLKRKAREDLVKVLDFGIAKLNEGEGRKHITGVSEFVGTPSYMSPEQANGDALDARSDLYAVGALLFELVTGRPVFEGPTPMSVVTQHLKATPPRLNEVAPGKSFSPAFEQVVRKALAKDREERFSSAEAMIQALERARNDLGYSLHDLTPLPEELQDVARREDFDRFERSLRMRRVLAPVLVLSLLGLAGAAGYRYLVAAEAAVRPSESEPNNQPVQANRIALGQPIRGMVGARLGDRDSDRDLYVLDVPRGQPLTVELAGVEDMNLVMQLMPVDEGGKSAARGLLLDDAPTGLGERVDGFDAPAGQLYLRVEERRYFTEPNRPPRETTRGTYALKVTATGAPVGARLEVEPNDKLDAATAVPPGAALVGFTGTVAAYNVTFAQLELSGADFIAAELGSTPPPAWAVVVPPAGGKLLAVDAGEFDAWKKKMDAYQEGLPPPRLPAAVPVARPEVLPLTESRRGRAVRIQADGETPPGSAYSVAFVTSAPEGLTSAMALVRALEGEGRAADADAVVKLAERVVPRAPRLAELKALRAGKDTADAKLSEGGPK